MFGKIGNIVADGIRRVQCFEPNQKKTVNGKDNDLLIKGAGITAAFAISFFLFITIGAKATAIVASLLVGGYALHKFINKEGFDFSSFWKWNSTDETKTVKHEDVKQATT